MKTPRERLIHTITAVYAYYERELSRFALAMWEEDLGTYAIEDVERAFKAHRRDPDRGQYLPRTADIIRQLQGDTTDRALIAWGSVLDSARNGGGFKATHCEATRQAVQAMGGWSVLCRSDESSNGFLQKRFTDLFAAYQRMDEREVTLSLASDPKSTTNERRQIQ